MFRPVFCTAVMAFNIVKHEELLSPTISGSEVEEVKRLARETSDIFKLLAKSIAPSVFGLDFIKEALVCQVLNFIF